MDEVNAMEYTAERLIKYEQLYRKYEKVLQPNHFIHNALRQNLIEMYGHINGYTLSQLPDIILEHKINLCRQILHILNVFHPGRTRSRAMLIYELHAPIVLTARSKYAAGMLNAKELNEKLQDAINMLDECALILNWEDVTSTEAAIAQICEQTSDAIKSQLSTV